MAFVDMPPLASGKLSMADATLFLVQLFHQAWNGWGLGDEYVSIQYWYVYIAVGYFAGKPADYVFMLLFNCICLNVSSSPCRWPVVSYPSVSVCVANLVWNIHKTINVLCHWTSYFFLTILWLRLWGYFWVCTFWAQLSSSLPSTSGVRSTKTPSYSFGLECKWRYSPSFLLHLLSPSPSSLISFFCPLLH